MKLYRLSTALASIAMAGLLAAAVPASAAPMLTSVLSGQPLSGPGVFYENLDTLGPYANGLTVTLLGGAALVTGNSPGNNAAPYINGNGGHFGQGAYIGPDLSQYAVAFSNVGSTVQFSWATQQKYFGVLLGSADTYNNILFKKGGVTVGTFTGADFTPTATGDQGPNGTYYGNFFDALDSFDSVFFTSSSPSAELDNIAFSSGTPVEIPVPEPGTWMMMLFGLGALAFRKKLAAAFASNGPMAGA